MRILIIDDEPLIMEDLKYTLKKIGYYVDSTTYPIEALKLYTTEKYDLVITDLNMPLMSGFDLIKKILELNEKAIIVVISASEDKEYEVLNCGAFGFLEKPIKISLLVEMLKKAGEEIRM
ncbi:MAG: response regulator [Brevinematales bacterium]|jgi:DNA-binding response OmpR family regulator